MPANLSLVPSPRWAPQHAHIKRKIDRQACPAATVGNLLTVQNCKIFSYHYPDSPPHNAPPPTPRAESAYDYDPRETMILAGTPPPDRPPPPPPVEEPFSYQNGSYYEENTIKECVYLLLLRKLINNSMDSLDQSPPLPPTPAPRAPLPVIKRNIVYAKDRIAQFEALNTTERAKEGSPKDHNSKDYQSIKDYSTSRETKRFQPFSYTPLTESSTLTSKSMYDEYPIYNPVSDYTFKSGMTFQQGAFPIDVNRVNIGFCGRQGAGKSTLINALRGLSLGDPQTAGRNPCDNMEPFRSVLPDYPFLFIEDTLQNIILWEIPYPRTFTNVIDIYDRNMGFDRFYESHKLNLFHRLFVLIPDGAPHDDDVSFSKVVHSRRTPLTLLSTKTDDDLDAESRETGRMVGEVLKKEYDSRARNVFTKSLMTKAQILASTELLLISSPTVRNLVSGTTGLYNEKSDLLNIREYKEPLKHH
uniref:IRG-type G domain-containing protein n=1 Tax=Heterorhabditis bacteriophora TaxID=37862 RepID=A0A1I7XCE5_HETBA